VNQILKFDSRAIRLGLTSDWHLFHAKEFLYGGRGFKNVEEHNAGVIATLQDFDTLIHLGDMFLNATEEQAICALDKIPGTIYTLWGNHNAVLWPVFKREMAQKYGEGLEVYPYRWRNVIFIGNQATVEIDKKTIVLNHFPLQIWDGRKHGFFHLAGHSHGSFKQTRPEHPQDYRLDIGWDIHKKPLTMGEIRAIMNGKSIGEPLDHH